MASMARRFLVGGLLATAALANIQAAVAQSTSAPFPRLGGYLIGASYVESAFATPSYQQQVAKLGVAIIGTYPGWSSGGFDNQTAAAAVKAINPNIVLTLYSIPEEVPTSPGAYAPAWSLANTPNQWLRTAWPSGSIVQHASGYDEANMTTSSAKNASGLNYPAARAAYDAAYATSNWNGIYVDNFGWIPLVSGDFMQTGGSQSPSSVQQAYRDGYAAYVSYFRSVRPGSQVWGNVATWGQGGANLTGYNQVLNGGVMESIIGQSYSYETWGGWSGMMSYYRTVMSYTIPPGYQIFEQDGTATDYQGMRYGLASCLMDNGYYYFNVTGPGGGSLITWFDEFNASLGQASSQPPTSAWQNGVYRRDFANGIALVNPKGNGPQTVTLETAYRHLSGTQAPSVNNGQTVTSVTLNDRDGVILMRLTAQSVPDPPTLTVQ